MSVNPIADVYQIIKDAKAEALDELANVMALKCENNTVRAVSYEMVRVHSADIMNQTRCHVVFVVNEETHNIEVSGMDHHGAHEKLGQKILDAVLKGLGPLAAESYKR